MSRYLGLQCGDLEKLPSTIGNLVNLQSLILGGRHVLEVPAHTKSIRRRAKSIRTGALTTTTACGWST